MTLENTLIEYLKGEPIWADLIPKIEDHLRDEILMKLYSMEKEGVVVSKFYPIGDSTVKCFSLSSKQTVNIQKDGGKEEQ